MNKTSINNIVKILLAQAALVYQLSLASFPEGDYRPQCLTTSINNDILSGNCFLSSTDGYLRNSCRRPDQGTDLAACERNLRQSSLNVTFCAVVGLTDNGILICLNDVTPDPNSLEPAGPYRLPLPRFSGDIPDTNNRGCDYCSFDVDQSLTCVCPRGLGFYRDRRPQNRPVEYRDAEYCKRCFDRERNNLAAFNNCRIGGFVQGNCLDTLWRRTTLKTQYCVPNSVAHENGALRCAFDLSGLPPRLTLYSTGTPGIGKSLDLILEGESYIEGFLPQEWIGLAKSAHICSANAYLYGGGRYEKLLLRSATFENVGNRVGQQTPSCKELIFSPDQSRDFNNYIITNSVQA